MKRYFKELLHAEFLNLKSPVNVHSSFVTSCRNTCISAINLEISPLRSFKIKVVLLQCISLVLMIGSTHVINMYYGCKLSTIIFLKPEIMLSVYALNFLILCMYGYIQVQCPLTMLFTYTHFCLCCLSDLISYNFCIVFTIYSM